MTRLLTNIQQSPPERVKHCIGSSLTDDQCHLAGVCIPDVPERHNLQVCPCINDEFGAFLHATRFSTDQHQLPAAGDSAEEEEERWHQ